MPTHIQQSDLTAKGSLLSASASGTLSVLAPGTDAQVLTADSTVASGIKWATPAASTPSIGGGITSGTTGSVLFVGAGPVFAQNNANLFWDNTNTRLGIGTNIPDSPIHVVTSSASHIFHIKNTVASGNAGTLIFGQIVQPVSSGYDMLGLYANNNVSQFNVRGDGHVGVGSGNPASGATLNVTDTTIAGNSLFQFKNLITSGYQATLFFGSLAQGDSAQYDLFGLYNATNVPKFNIRGDGNVGIGTITYGTANKLIVNPYSTQDNLATTQINTSVATNKGLVVQGFAYQSANLMEIQNSAGTVLSKADSGGNISVLGNVLIGAMFTQTASQTVSNVAETTLFGTGVGTKTLAAGTLVVGKTIRIRGWAVFSTQAVPGNVTVKIYLGATVIATGTITNILALASNNAAEFTADITCRTTGITGTVVVGGSVGYDTGVLAQGFLALNNAGATTTVDTTASLAVDVKLLWATQAVANTITVFSTTLEILN